MCDAPWRGDGNLCKSCGADLYDPDVQAFAGGKAPGSVPLGTDDPSQQAAADAAGMLGAGQVAGVRLEGLLDGTALRRLGVIGGMMLLVAFVLPAVRDYERVFVHGDWGYVGSYRYSWDLLVGGNALALLFPLVAGLLGLVVAFVPGLSTPVRASLLGAAGLIGLVLCLGQLGSYGMAPTSTATLTTLGAILAGIGMAARVLLPQSTPARWTLVAASVVFTAGMLIPVGDLSPRLPFDYSFYGDWLGADLTDAVPVATIASGVDRRAMGLFFVAVWMLLPLVLFPAAAYLSWRRPQGVWDKDGLALRPLSWLIVLYLPLLYGLMAFSAGGWDDQASKSAMLGRIRLFVVCLPLVLWSLFGFLGALLSRLPARATAPAAPATPATSVAAKDAAGVS